MSAVVQKSYLGGGGSTAIERTLFEGHRVSNEIKKMIGLVAGLDKLHFRLILSATTTALEGKDMNMKEFVEKMSRAHLTQESLSVIVSGLYQLLHLALRSTPKSEELFEDLKDLKIPENFITDIINVVTGQRQPVLLKNVMDDGVHLNKLERLKWRVDVGISTSTLSRLLEPSICTEMMLSNGSIFPLEMSVQKFHELRYSIAHVLKEIEILQMRNILKIQD